MNKVVLLKNHSNWQRHFKQLKQEILARTDIIEAIEHVGSTAVANLSAKNVIDVQLGVLNLNEIEALKKVLKALGFKQIESIQQDHVPMHAFDYFELGWEKLFYRGDYKGITFHLHIRKYNNPNWNYAILIRDYLNQHPEVLTLYEQIKFRLAKSGLDSKTYSYIKDPVFDLIYLLAKS